MILEAPDSRMKAGLGEKTPDKIKGKSLINIEQRYLSSMKSDQKIIQNNGANSAIRKKLNPKQT
jgi:hypothetical protein